MSASISTIVTMGFGSFGSVNLIPTLGYGIGTPVNIVNGPLIFPAAAVYRPGAKAGDIYRPGAMAGMKVGE